MNKVPSSTALGMTRVLSGTEAQEVIINSTGGTPSRFREKNRTMAQVSGTTMSTLAELVASTNKFPTIERDV